MYRVKGVMVTAAAESGTIIILVALVREGMRLLPPPRRLLDAAYACSPCCLTFLHHVPDGTRHFKAGNPGQRQLVKELGRPYSDGD